MGFALTAASLVLGGVSASREAKNQARWGDYYSQVAQENARGAQEDARQQQKDTGVQLERTRREQQRYLARIRAGYGASGVVSGSGSPLEVLGESAYNMQLEREEMLRQGGYTARDSFTRAGNYRNQAYSARAGAASSRFEGRSSFQAGLIGGASSLISGVQSNRLNAYRLRRAGV